VQDFLVIENVTKSFGPTRAVDGVSLQIGQGEVFSLLGPSGCGKTTLLRMLAGFEQPNRGRICLNGQDITALPPERRPVNTVFQNYALFPHLTVWENIAFGLRIAKKAKATIHGTVERMLHLVRLQEHAAKRPAQLSGGQRQRVAIARALVNEPQVLLLDEPLAALDLKLRQHMLSELTALHAEVGTTFIYVTHDQSEAIGLSDRIAVMDAGKVAQVATPSALYETPATAFVASFIGDANLLRGRVQAKLPQNYVRISIDGLGNPLVTTASETAIGDVIQIIVRPEKLHISHERPAGNERMNVFRCLVEEMIYFGPHTRVRLLAGNQRILVQCQANPSSHHQTAFKPNMEAWVSFDPDAAHVLPGKLA
jgi:spermidine/putrescine transport system ATP-binding protein